MYVCVCKNVTDSQIKKAIKNGAQNLHQVKQKLNLGTQCCKCLPTARQIIQQELQNQEKAGTPSVSALGIFTPS